MLLSKGSEHNHAARPGLRKSTGINTHIAVASLMFKVIESDGEIDHMEVAHMVNILRNHFSLSTSEIENLLATARQVSKRGLSVQHLTQKLCQDWTPRQRQQLLNDCWLIASADEKIKQNERSVISEIASHLQLDMEEITRAQYDAETKMELGIQ